MHVLHGLSCRERASINEEYKSFFSGHCIYHRYLLWPIYGKLYLYAHRNTGSAYRIDVVDKYTSETASTTFATRRKGSFDLSITNLSY